MGDRPDFGVDVSVRCVMASEAGQLLDTARQLAVHPIDGIAPVVDLTTHDLEAFVAYRWIEGKSLAALLAASALTNVQAHALIESVGHILERMARGPLRDVPAPSLLTLEQIIVTPDNEVRIVDWAFSGAGYALDVAGLLRGLERGVLPATQLVPRAAVAAPPARAGGIGFDAALGAALSGGAAEEAGRSPTQAAASVDTRSAPHLAWPTVAATYVPPANASPREPTPASPTPASYGRTSSRAIDSLLGAFGGALLALGATAIGMYVREAREVAPPPASATSAGPAPTAANPTPVATAPATPTPTLVDASAPPPVVVAHGKSTPSHARPTTSAALLSISTDVPAAVYVDGTYVGDTPLAKESVAGGAHHLRLEALEQSMRLLPLETDVTLPAGEERKLRFGLR
jgi:hypothetical protein